MTILDFFNTLNYQLAVPTAFILLGVALFLTFKLRFLQITGLPKFFSLLRHGIKKTKPTEELKTIDSFYALFTAMSTSIGMGTIVGPSVAIIMGGPGALFWLVFYAICGSITKFAEVTFAVNFRQKTSDGSILGGPMQYLTVVHPYLGTWYAFATIFLFAGWSGLQSNVLAETLAQECIPSWFTGLALAILVYIMLSGGAQRIGEFSSKLVPLMFIIYVTSGLYILIKYYAILPQTLRLIMETAFAPAPIGAGFMGACLFASMRSGIYKGAFITESGMGTSSIPHSLANVQRPSDQGILAMSSVYVDAFLCTLSGLLVLVTGVWQINTVSNTLMYKIFQANIPILGRFLLISSISMFVIGTVIGNSFNGRQSFAAITKYRWLQIYYFYICAIIFFGAIMNVPLIWAITEVILPLVAVPNVIGILYLTHRYPDVLKI